jgi:hypothetical protein
MARWNLGSYNRFIGAARRERPDLSVNAARALYREMHSKLDRPVFSSDIQNHPRIFERLATEQQSREAQEDAEEFYEEMPDEEDLIDIDEEWEVGGKADYGKKAK